MAYDLEEQEQLDAMKAWWNRYGSLVTWVLIVVLAAYAAWNGWNAYQRKQSLEASVLYEQLQSAVNAKDSTMTQRVASDLESRYGRTAYAEIGALTAAKSAFELNDSKTAETQLRWVVDNGKNPEYRAVARIRLAGLLLDDKAYDKALEALAGDMPAAYAGVVADRRGDVLAAQNKRDEARQAYRLALEKMAPNNPGRQLVQLKLDALGGVKAA